MDDNRESGGGIIMSSWAARMQRRATTLGTVVTSCGHAQQPYPRRIDKVKFGIPLEDVCKNDIPGPLLILILKLNKEGPYRKDVFRAPGHHGNMKKLIHFLQNGRLVNIDNYSVYTIASVLKKFLRKLPGGIFGIDGEQQLFEMIEMPNVEEQRDHIHILLSSLPTCTQRLIVLLFGTFRVIASNSERLQTGMTSEALGVSVAPSFFQTCVSDGKTAKMEDVQRFKAEVDVATRVMKFLIDNFGVSNLYGRSNYEYYARITGRILKIEEDWIFSFRYPPDSIVSRQMSLWAEKAWLEDESLRWGLRINLKAMSQQEESQSTPALLQTNEKLDVPETGEASSSLTIIPENSLLESYTKLSISLEDNGLFKDSIDKITSRSSSNLHMTLDELRAVNHYAESTKSLTFLPQVHERQAARMKTRSEWFLSPTPIPYVSLHDTPDKDRSRKATLYYHEPQDRDEAGGNSYFILRDESMTNRKAGGGNIFGSGADSLKQLVRRSSSKEKDRKLLRRNSSKKNKENGSNVTNSGVANTSTSTNVDNSHVTSTTNKPKSTPSSFSPSSQPKEPPPSTSIVILPPSPSTDSSSNSHPHSGTIDALSTIVNVSENESDQFRIQDDEDIEPQSADYESPLSPGDVLAEEKMSALSLSSPKPPESNDDDMVAVEHLAEDNSNSRQDINGAVGGVEDPQQIQPSTSISTKDCTETNVQTFHVTLTYKPRI